MQAKGRKQMSKRLWMLPVLAALLVAGSGIGFAAIPSLGGGTGIVTVPNALVAPVGQLSVEASYQSVQSALATGIEAYEPLDDSFSVWSLQALAGVADGAELWAAYSKDTSDLDTAVWAIGGKYKFYTDATYGADIAIGAAYRSASGDANLILNIGEYEVPDFQPVDYSLDATVFDAYLVVTKDFASMAGSEWCPGSKLLGSLGVLYKDLNVDEEAVAEFVTLTGEFDDSLFRPFVAVQWIGADRTSLGLEYRWEDNDLDADPVFSAVLGYDWENGFGAQVGTTNADQLGFGTGDQNWFASVSYTFAMGAAW
jgi:hypothetical protein